MLSVLRSEIILTGFGLNKTAKGKNCFSTIQDIAGVCAIVPMWQRRRSLATFLPKIGKACWNHFDLYWCFCEPIVTSLDIIASQASQNYVSSCTNTSNVCHRVTPSHSSPASVCPWKSSPPATWNLERMVVDCDHDSVCCGCSCGCGSVCS